MVTTAANGDEIKHLAMIGNFLPRQWAVMPIRLR
jgi:hypothetical protein